MEAAFTGSKFYLSNMYPSPINLWGAKFPTAEHAYVYAKVAGWDSKLQVHKIPNPKQAKKFGASVPIEDNWDSTRLEKMEEILRAKFDQHPELARRLAEEQGEIVEYNYWKDDFWGVCTEAGQNHLGKLLMKLRDEIRVSNPATSIWDFYDQGYYVVIPTNLQTRKDGSAVMGAGIARQAADRFPELPAIYGEKLRSKNQGHYLNRDFRVICVPTKEHWRTHSTLELVRLAVFMLKHLPKDIERVAVPALGCGLGGLSWRSVEPLLRELPADRFVVIPPQ